jgi:hypothetical protein
MMDHSNFHNFAMLHSFANIVHSIGYNPDLVGLVDVLAGMDWWLKFEEQLVHSYFCKIINKQYYYSS